MSKFKSTAKLLNLSFDKQERICTWLMEGVEGDTSYKKVKDQIWLDLNIRTSESAIGIFYQRFVAPRRLRIASDSAQQLAGVAKGMGANFEAGALAALQQKAFEILASDKPDSKEVIAFFGMVLEARKIDLKREELGLKKKQIQVKTCETFLKWYEDSKARRIAESGSSNSEKIEQLGQAMFDDWEEDSK